MPEQALLGTKVKAMTSLLSLAWTLWCLQAILHWQQRLMRSVLRSWRQATDILLYRRHVIQVVSIKVNNGLMLKAFNCWR